MDSLSGFPQEWLRSVPCSNGKSTWTPSETLVICPYDRNHRVMKNKFSDHLTRCRRNYELNYEELEKGLPLTVSCRYDMKHRFYAPELEYHEYGCDKRGTAITLARTYAKNAALLEAICNANVDEKKGKSDVKQRHMASSVNRVQKNIATARRLAELMEEVENDKVDTTLMGGNVAELATGLIEMVQMRHEKSEIQWADPVVAEKFGVPINCNIGWRVQMRFISQAVDMEAFGAIRRVKWVHQRDTYFQLNPRVGEEQDEDWERVDHKLDNFDWMEHQKYVKGVSHRVPAGLTRKQRKAFWKENAVRLMYEEGWFLDEHDDE